MKWRGRRASGNVEDRRGRRLVRRAGGGGIGMIALALVAMYFGVDPRVVMQLAGGGGGTVSEQRTDHRPSAAEQELAAFVSVVLADTEDAWHGLFREQGGNYREPRLVLFTDAVQSACGAAQAAMGPFYCPADSQVYIDLGFYRDLRERLGAPGDFAQAYVIAHEVGHHVQNLLGISSRVHEARRRLGEAEGNALSVRQELQADCFAGIWANHARDVKQVLEHGDIDEALGAASAIGDDRLQRRAGGRVVPDSFTHGTSAQRTRWFTRGLQGGRIADCDTFATNEL